jgi:FKBP-type peptidyl-prolyl cis-trans isomerase FkpA
MCVCACDPPCEDVSLSSSSFVDATFLYRNVLREKLESRGREMLKNMAETEGVKVLDSGVVVHVLEHGPEGPGYDQGIRPTKTSVVQIHYHGTLSDGTVFDSTMGADPVNFPLANVVPGWREGVLAMQEGETAMLGIPPEQAYGAEGTPDGRIPGGSTLFFKVQLIKVLTAQVGGSGLVGPDGKALKKDRGSTGSGLIL